MANGTLVLTGATGFCGFAILQSALRDGYNVRIIARSESKAESLRTNPALVALNKSSQCSYYVVSDLSAQGALDEASAGADYMIHTASPLPFQLVEPEKQWDEIVQPAINNTISALESAERSKTVKRVVITSSVGAFITPEMLLNPIDKSVHLTEANKNAEIPPPYDHLLTSYVASKTSALLRSEQWMLDHKPSFDVVNLAPGYVMGRNELATSTKDLFTTSNSMFLRIATGTAPSDSPSEVATVIHIDDVAKIHLMALEKERIPADEYIFARPVQWNDVAPITKKLFPEQVEKGVLPNNGNVPTKPVVFGAEKAIKTFGVDFRSVEDMVRDIVGQYLELLEKEKTTST